MTSAAKMEGDPGFRSFAERCEPPEPSAAQDRQLIVSEGKLEHALGRRLDARVVRAILVEIEPENHSAASVHP